MAVLSSPVLFIASIPPVTRVFTAATFLSSFLYTWLRWREVDSAPYLTLVPGSSIFYPWTFVTSALVETSIFEVSVVGSLISTGPLKFKRDFSLLPLLCLYRRRYGTWRDYGGALKLSSSLSSLLAFRMSSLLYSTG